MLIYNIYIQSFFSSVKKTFLTLCQRMIMRRKKINDKKGLDNRMEMWINLKEHLFICVQNVVCVQKLIIHITVNLQQIKTISTCMSSITAMGLIIRKVVYEINLYHNHHLHVVITNKKHSYIIHHTYL